MHSRLHTRTSVAVILLYAIGISSLAVTLVACLSALALVAYAFVGRL